MIADVRCTVLPRLKSLIPFLMTHTLSQQVLNSVWNDLTDDQRHVIILRYLEGFNLNETATILGKQVNHIKVIQNRAIAKLRQALGDSGAETGLESNSK